MYSESQESDVCL